MENNYHEANHRLWNEWTRLNLEEPSDYQALIAQFQRDETTLPEIIRKEVGNVEGKSLLHLMCHIGLDTLSWARQGAAVTGVDFSEESICAARLLSKKYAIPAEFICSDIYKLGEVLDHQYDIVFTSTGVLPWLPDLGGWAAVIAQALKSGGIFYLHEIHPFRRLILPRREDANGQAIGTGYFNQAEPTRSSEQGSYANPTVNSVHTAYYWSHGLGEIITALCENGLRLDYLHEFPKLVEMGQVFARKADGQYEVQPVQNLLVPNAFSIRAIK
jgi:2-polyprenyl-3-methyl-5-hydroxy-6-metoxy-1,4-benzoquinol methylase